MFFNVVCISWKLKCWILCTCFNVFNSNFIYLYRLYWCSEIPWRCAR